MKNYNSRTVATQNGDVTVWKINHDANGNPRFVVHFTSLGIELADYRKVKGLDIYRAKWFGGGYVFQSYNVDESLTEMIRVANNFNQMKKVGDLRSFKKMFGNREKEIFKNLISIETIQEDETYHVLKFSSKDDYFKYECNFKSLC